MENKTWIIALDCSTPVLSISLFQNNLRIAGFDLHDSMKQSQLAAALIQDLLQHVGIQVSDLSGIAVSVGPGSYTGLRVAVSIAKGIAFGLDIPILPLNSLLITASTCIELAKITKSIICPMIDARRMEVYTSILDFNLNTLQKDESFILTEEDMLFKFEGKNVVFCGDGAFKIKKLSINIPQTWIISENINSTQYLGNYCFEKWQNKQFLGIEELEVNYLKNVNITTKK